MNTSFPHFYPGWELVRVSGPLYFFYREEMVGARRAYSRVAIHDMDLPLASFRLERADRDFQAFIERSK